MPDYKIVESVVNGLVGLIEKFVEVMKKFINGFQKTITVGEEEAEG